MADFVRWKVHESADMLLPILALDYAQAVLIAGLDLQSSERGFLCLLFFRKGKV
jgi:hypothetical protein